jgi:hypothetical protein
LPQAGRSGAGRSGGVGLVSMVASIVAGGPPSSPAGAPVGEPCGQSPAWWLYRHRHERPRRLMPAVSRPPPRPPAEHRRQNRRPERPVQSRLRGVPDLFVVADDQEAWTHHRRFWLSGGRPVAAHLRLRERPVPAKREAVAGTPICGEPAFRRRNTQRITVPEPCREWTVCSCLALPRYAGSPLR